MDQELDLRPVSQSSDSELDLQPLDLKPIKKPREHDIRMPEWAPDWVPAPSIPDISYQPIQPQTDIRFTPHPGETGPKWINDIIRPRLGQLAGVEPGPLNPDPNQNPLVNQPIQSLEKPQGYEDPRHAFARKVLDMFGPMETPQGYEDPRHMIGRHAWDFIRQNIFTPVGAYGLTMGHPPGEPIPNPYEINPLHPGHISELAGQLGEAVRNAPDYQAPPPVLKHEWQGPRALPPATEWEAARERMNERNLWDQNLPQEGPFVAGKAGIAEPKLYNIDWGQSQPPDISRFFTGIPEPGGWNINETVKGATPNPEEVVQVPPEIAAEYGTGIGRPYPETYNAPYYPAPPERGPAMFEPPSTPQQPTLEGMPERGNLIRPNEPELDLRPMEPLSMAREGERTYVDMGAGTGKLIGRALYGSNPGGSSTKELLQNALDATEDLGPNRRIGVKMGNEPIPGSTESTRYPYIEVTDNGPGLTRPQLDKEFSNISESGKRGMANQRGKFGAGKGAYLLGGEYADIDTVALDNGQKVRLQWRGDADQFLNKDDPRNVVTTTIVPPDTPTGTTVRTYLPIGQNITGVKPYLEKMFAHSRGISGKINLVTSAGEVKDVDLSTFGSAHIALPELDFQHPKTNTAIRFFSKPEKPADRSFVNLHLLNNGAYQGTQNIYLDRKVTLPADLVADVSTAADAESREYPWEMNREKLRQDITTDLTKHFERIGKEQQHARETDLGKVYESLPQIEVRGVNRKVRIYDSGNGFSPEEIHEIANHPVVHDWVRWMNGLLDTTLKVMNKPDWNNKIEGIGLMFREANDGPFTPEGGYHLGLWMPDPKTKKATIFVNIPGILARNSPDSATTAISHTILHEIAHTEPVGAFEDPHGKTMIYQVGDIYTQLGRRNIHGFEDALIRQLAGSPEGSQYLPQVQKLLQGYIESRGRAEISSDPLSKQGSSITGQGQKIFGIARPTPEGAFTRLFRDESGSVMFGKKGAGLSDLERARLEDRRAGAVSPEDEGSTINPLEAIHQLPLSMGPGGDVSFALRQAKPYVAHTAFWKAWVPAVKALGSDEASALVHQQLMENPRYAEARRDGLFLADVGDNPNKREEFLTSNLAEKIPIAGKYYRATNRANTAFLNAVRMKVYEQMMDSAEALGGNLEEMGPKYAEHINNMTGHGSLNFQGPKFQFAGHTIDMSINAERAHPFLRYTMFAPRFLASRLKMFTTFGKAILPVPDSWIGMDPVLRQESLRNLFAVAGLAIGSSILTKLAGGSVETDPTSADYMKNRFGLTRFDPLIGLQQYIVLASRLKKGELKQINTGNKYTLGSRYGLQTDTDVAMRFLQNKSHPWINFAMELGRAIHGDITKASTWHNMTAYGKPYHPLDQFLQLFVPMTLNDMYQIYKTNPKLLPLGAPLSFFGESTQTFEPE